MACCDDIAKKSDCDVTTHNPDAGRRNLAIHLFNGTWTKSFVVSVSPTLLRSYEKIKFSEISHSKPPTDPYLVRAADARGAVPSAGVRSSSSQSMCKSRPASAAKECVLIRALCWRKAEKQSFDAILPDISSSDSQSVCKSSPVSAPNELHKLRRKFLLLRPTLGDSADVIGAVHVDSFENGLT